MEGDAHPDPCLDLRPEIAEARRRAARFAVERRRQHHETPLWLLSLPPPVAMDGDAHLVSFLDHHPELAEERRRARSPDERRFARSTDERRRARSADERRRQHNYERRRLRDVGRRWRRNPISEPSSSRETERSARTQGAGTAISVQQSLLYSNFPMQSGSRRGRERSPSKLPVEEHASEVNSSEGSVTMGLSEFTALALNDTPPKLQSTYWSNVCYDTGSSETESETVVENPEEESDFDLEKELQEMEDYLQENTCNTISEAMDKILAVERSTLAAKYDNMSAAERADMTARSSYFSKRLPPLWWLSSPADSETQSLQATEQASRNEPSRQCLLRRQPRGEVPDEEIIQNGKNWMTKEVMLAFEEYAERSTNLTGLDWQIEELCHQCFNVEYYHKVFHHYNFTVKIESPKSSDSRVALFFAEVKEIFGRKYYFCCPLEPNENGQCYACNNQGVDDLRHPATGGYDRGSKDIAFPFICMD